MKTNNLAIIAPSLSPAVARGGLYQAAASNLAQHGFSVSWAPAANAARTRGYRDTFDSLPLESRLADLAWAVASDAKFMLCALGGYNAYQLLARVPWSAMHRGRKILIGHSDPTILLAAYYRKTGAVSWYGPNMRTLGDKSTGKLSVQNLCRVLQNERIEWKAASIYKDPSTENSRRVRGWSIIQPGKVYGIGIGGNLGSLFLLQGTSYMPRFTSPTVLFLEEDEMPGKMAIREFDRKLRSLLDQKGARQHVRGLIIGRFLDESQTTTPMIRDVIKAIPFLADKPVIANVEIGHGSPRILLPIGGTIEMDTEQPTIVVYNTNKGVSKL